MSIIPLTTELMIREHARKTILREIRKTILKRLIEQGGGEPSDEAGEVEFKPAEGSGNNDVSSVVPKLGKTDPALIFDAQQFAQAQGITPLPDDELKGLIGILQHENDAYIYAECIDLMNQMFLGDDAELAGLKKYADGMLQSIPTFDVEGTDVERQIIDFFGLALADKTDDLFFLRLALSSFGEDYNTWPEFFGKFIGEEVVTFGAAGVAGVASKGVSYMLKLAGRAPIPTSSVPPLTSLRAVGDATSRVAGREAREVEFPELATDLTDGELKVLQAIYKSAGKVTVKGTPNTTILNILELSTDESDYLTRFLAKTTELGAELGEDATEEMIRKLAKERSAELHRELLKRLDNAIDSLEAAAADDTEKFSRLQNMRAYKGLLGLKDGVAANSEEIIENFTNEIMLPVINTRRRNISGLVEVGIDPRKAQAILSQVNTRREAISETAWSRFKDVASGGFGATMEAMSKAGISGIPGYDTTIALAAVKYVFGGNVPGQDKIISALNNMSKKLYEQTQQDAKKYVIRLLTDPAVNRGQKETIARRLGVIEPNAILDDVTLSRLDTIVQGQRITDRAIREMAADGSAVEDHVRDAAEYVLRFERTEEGRVLKQAIDDFIELGKEQGLDFAQDEQSAYYLLNSAIKDASGLTGTDVLPSNFSTARAIATFTSRILFGTFISHAVDNSDARIARLAANQISGADQPDIKGILGRVAFGSIGTFVAPNVVTRELARSITMPGVSDDAASTVPLTKREIERIEDYYSQPVYESGEEEFGGKISVERIISQEVLKSYKPTDPDTPEAIRRAVPAATLQNKQDLKKSAIQYTYAKLYPLMWLGSQIDDAGDSTIHAFNEFIGREAYKDVSPAALMSKETQPFNPFPKLAERIYDSLLTGDGAKEYISAIDSGAFYFDGEANNFFDAAYATRISAAFLEAVKSIVENFDTKESRSTPATVQAAWKKFSRSMKKFEDSRKATRYAKGKNPVWGKRQNVVFMEKIEERVLVQQGNLSRAGVNEKGVVAYSRLKKLLKDLQSTSTGPMEEGVKYIESKKVREIVRHYLNANSAKKKRIISEAKKVTADHLKARIEDVLQTVTSDKGTVLDSDAFDSLFNASAGADVNSDPGFTYGIPVEEFYNNPDYIISAYSGMLEFTLDDSGDIDEISYGEFNAVVNYNPRAIDSISYRVFPNKADGSGEPDKTKDKIFTTIDLATNTTISDVASNTEYELVSNVYSSEQNFFSNTKFSHIGNDISLANKAAGAKYVYTNAERENFVQNSTSRKNAVVEAYNALLADETVPTFKDGKFQMPIVVFGRFNKSDTGASETVVNLNDAPNSAVAQSVFDISNVKLNAYRSYKSELGGSLFAFYTPVFDDEALRLELANAMQTDAAREGFKVDDDAELETPPPPETPPDAGDPPSEGEKKSDGLKDDAGDPDVTPEDKVKKLKKTIELSNGRIPYPQGRVGGTGNTFISLFHSGIYVLKHDLDSEETDNPFNQETIVYVIGGRDGISLDFVRNPLNTTEVNRLITETINHARANPANAPIFQGGTDQSQKLVKLMEDTIGDSLNVSVGDIDKALRSEFPEVYGDGGADGSAVAQLMLDISNANTELTSPSQSGTTGETDDTDTTGDASGARGDTTGARGFEQGRIKNGYIEVIEDGDFFYNFPLFSREDFEKYLTAQVEGSYIRDMKITIGFDVKFKKNKGRFVKSVVKLGRSGRSVSQEKADARKLFGKESIFVNTFNRQLEDYFDRKIIGLNNEFDMFSQGTPDTTGTKSGAKEKGKGGAEAGGDNEALRKFLEALGMILGAPFALPYLSIKKLIDMSSDEEKEKRKEERAKRRALRELKKYHIGLYRMVIAIAKQAPDALFPERKQAIVDKAEDRISEIKNYTLEDYGETDLGVDGMVGVYPKVIIDSTKEAEDMIKAINKLFPAKGRVRNRFQLEWPSFVSKLLDNLELEKITKEPKEKIETKRDYYRTFKKGVRKQKGFMREHAKLNPKTAGELTNYIEEVKTIEQLAQSVYNDPNYDDSFERLKAADGREELDEDTFYMYYYIMLARRVRRLTEDFMDPNGPKPLIQKREDPLDFELGDRGDVNMKKGKKGSRGSIFDKASDTRLMRKTADADIEKAKSTMKPEQKSEIKSIVSNIKQRLSKLAQVKNEIMKGRKGLSLDDSNATKNKLKVVSTMKNKFIELQADLKASIRNPREFLYHHNDGKERLEKRFKDINDTYERLITSYNEKYKEELSQGLVMYKIDTKKMRKICTIKIDSLGLKDKQLYESVVPPSYTNETNAFSALTNETKKSAEELYNFFLNPNLEIAENPGFTFVIKCTAQGIQDVQDVPEQDDGVILRSPEPLRENKSRSKSKIKVSRAFKV